MLYCLSKKKEEKEEKSKEAVQFGGHTRNRH